MTHTAISLKSVNVVSGGKTILEDITFSLPPKTCCAVLGPNGSGKSTLIAVITGYIWPRSGSVTVLGKIFGQTPLASVRKQIGLIEPSRTPNFNNRCSVEYIVATGLFGTIMLPPNTTVTAKMCQKVRHQIQSVGLEQFAKYPLHKLSTGEQTKTLIARSLVAEPKILILDEPTVGLDIAARASVIKVLDNLMTDKNAPTILIVSHHLDELPTHLDHVILMKKGRIVTQGKPDECITEKNFTSTFDSPVKIVKNGKRYTALIKNL